MAETLARDRRTRHGNRAPSHRRSARRAAGHAASALRTQRAPSSGYRLGERAGEAGSGRRQAALALREFMEEVLIDDNMVFDIDNLKGFLNDTSSFGFIAKENNKIIGFAYCYTLLRPDGKTMFYLHSIGMLPNYQDKGYGSKLLSFIKEYSKEIGCSEMFLITDKGNPRACHVYEKLGGKNDYKDEIVYVYDYEKGDK